MQRSSFTGHFEEAVHFRRADARRGRPGGIDCLSEGRDKADPSKWTRSLWSIGRVARYGELDTLATRFHIVEPRWASPLYRIHLGQTIIPVRNPVDRETVERPRKNGLHLAGWRRVHCYWAESAPRCHRDCFAGRKGLAGGRKYCRDCPLLIRGYVKSLAGKRSSSGVWKIR